MEARSKKARFGVEVLPVLGQVADTVEPGECAFDNPASRQHDEALLAVGSFDDLDFGLGHDAFQGLLEIPVPDNRRQQRVSAGTGTSRRQRGEQHDAGIAILVSSAAVTMVLITKRSW